MLKLAFFISYHGFGHATRAGAVMAAIRQVAPVVHFEIFTQAPGWLFQEVLGGDFSLHPVMTDVGVVQRGPLKENWPLTLQRLDGFMPFDPDLIADLSRKIEALGCSLVVCDIAPLGLAVARAAGRPSVLIENFTRRNLSSGTPRRTRTSSVPRSAGILAEPGPKPVNGPDPI